MTTAPKATSPVRPLLQAENLNVCNLSLPPPAGFSVEKLDPSGAAVEIYSYDPVNGWEDLINGGPVTSTAINGPVIFRNPAAYDIDITW